MNIDQILSDLRAEHAKIDQAIRALEGTRRGRPAGTGGAARAANGRRKHNMTAAGRRRLSQMMKKRWAERRKVGKNRAA